MSEFVAFKFPRISHDINIMTGRACIKGTRVTVSMILRQLSHGVSHAELLDDYPYLTQEDILEALGYAAWLASASEFEVMTA